MGAPDLRPSEPRGPCSASLPRWPLGGCRRDTGSRPTLVDPRAARPWLNRACPPLGTLWSTPQHRHTRPIRGADHHSDGDRQRHPPGPAIGPAALPAGGAPATQLQRVGVWAVPWGIQRPWDWCHGTGSPAASTAAQFPPAAGSAPPEVTPCWRLQRPEAHLPADRQLCPRPGAAETGAHLPRQKRRWGGLRIVAVSLSAWGNPAGVRDAWCVPDPQEMPT